MAFKLELLTVPELQLPAVRTAIAPSVRAVKSHDPQLKLITVIYIQGKLGGQMMRSILFAHNCSQQMN